MYKKEELEDHVPHVIKSKIPNIIITKIMKKMKLRII